LVHILSPFDPLIIQRKRTDCFSAMAQVRGPICRRKNASSAIRAARCWPATKSSPPSISRPTAEQKLLMQKWSWVGRGKAAKGEARKELKRRIEEELDLFERFSSRRSFQMGTRRRRR